MNKSNRWLVLSAWGFVAALSQLLWLNYAPILTAVQAKYQVNEVTAGLLILVFPLVYVLLSIPAGNYIDKYGYRKGIGLGVVIMTIFCWFRTLDQDFTFLLIAQTGIAVAQPLIINGISKLVLDWFDKEHEAIATGLGTMAMFIGMAVGMAATPPLVQAYGFHGSNIAYALATTLSAILFYFFVKKNPDTANSEQEVFHGKLIEFFKNKNLLKLFVLSFLGLGFFNGLTTWLELILAPHGINSEQAGIAGGVLILGGIVGAAIVPAFSDHFKKRKPFLLLSVLMATLTVYPLCNGISYSSVLVFSAIQGFFFLPAFSLLLEMCSEIVGKSHAAAATGILMLTGNLGGVVVVIAMELVKGQSQNYDHGVHLMFGLLLASFILSLTLPETRSEKNGQT